MNPLLLVDFYKVHHNKMYPEGMTKLYSNLTPRKSRLPGVDSVVSFGYQHFIKETLIKDFNENFFGKENVDSYYQSRGDGHRQRILYEYRQETGLEDVSHIEALYNLGYLPIEIKALEEGTISPIGVPVLTVTNTHPDFGWLVNYIETLLSCMLWQPITSATIANEYRKLLEYYAKKTTGSIEGVQWQAHDFSMRGMSSPQSAIISGMAHLTCFTGTDTIPAIHQLRKSYNATGLVGASVPATEHSVMCMGTKESEIETFERLLNLYPEGILSVVSDTWDLWKVLTEYLPALKDQILERNGKLVIRPDSGDPVDIICGDAFDEKGKYVGQIKSDMLKYYDETTLSEYKGVIELLWDVFGGTVNDKGFKVLDSHIGAIYGDSITLERAKEICDRLIAKGFATTNIVFGVGSFTYQYNTRDTFGFAMKATYGEITHYESDELAGFDFSNTRVTEKVVEAREIFKDPITDDGTKKSKKGLLKVVQHERLEVVDQQTWDGEAASLLTTVFKDSKLVRETTLEEIRERIRKS